eukprot:4300842-Pleurochrysis_carterae.AAC.1
MLKRAIASDGAYMRQTRERERDCLPFSACRGSACEMGERSLKRASKAFFVQIPINVSVEASVHSCARARARVHQMHAAVR